MLWAWGPSVIGPRGLSGCGRRALPERVRAGARLVASPVDNGSRHGINQRPPLGLRRGGGSRERGAAAKFKGREAHLRGNRGRRRRGSRDGAVRAPGAPMRDGRVRGTTLVGARGAPVRERVHARERGGEGLTGGVGSGAAGLGAEDGDDGVGEAVRRGSLVRRRRLIRAASGEVAGGDDERRRGLGRLAGMRRGDEAAQVAPTTAGRRGGSGGGSGRRQGAFSLTP